jgi:hypothetical protein
VARGRDPLGKGQEPLALRMAGTIVPDPQEGGNDFAYAVRPIAELLPGQDRRQLDDADAFVR